MNNTNRIHITPEDVLADVDEIADGSEPRSRCKYYIKPYGVSGINEVCEANYYVGNRVPYHEHMSGFETFLVDGGAIEILSQGKKAIVGKGDMVHLAPYTPHSIHALEDNSIWRAFHQGLWLVDRVLEERALRDRHWDTVFEPSFKPAQDKRQGSVWFDYRIPACRDAAASEISCIRTFDSALAEYTFEGLTLKLKVGRWETHGVKEIWQLAIDAGCTFSWDNLHPFTHLYDVFKGKVRVTLEGMEPFIASARDIIHMPRLHSGKIEVLEDAVLFDMGCQGFLLRFIEEVNFLKENEPDKLKDKALISELMNKHDYHVLFETL